MANAVINSLQSVFKLSLMSRQKQLSNREIKSVMVQRCENMFTNFEKEKSMNKYLRQSKRQPYDTKVFKRVSDCYMADTYSQKENTQFLEDSNCPNNNLAKLIEEKVKVVVIQHVEKYIKQIFQEHKSGLELFYRNQLASIKCQCIKMEKQYEQMCLTFQGMMNNMQSAKQKSKKIQKYAKKIEVLQLQKNFNIGISEMKCKIQSLSSQIEKMVISRPKNADQRVQPVLLNYQQARQIRLQDLRIVVDTFNHNFIEIDAKLKELFSNIG